MSAEPEEVPVVLTPRHGQLLHRLAGSLAVPGRSLLAWSRAFRVEDGRPLDFSAFPFQREIYDAFGDRSLPTVDVRKSAQCGISAAAVSLALYAADVWQAHVLYVLPTEDLAERFSDTRVKPAIEGSPSLRSKVTGTDTKGLKRLGNANLHFVGSVAETNAIAIPADVLLFDEYDRLSVKHVPKFEQRLAAPTSLKLIRRFSTPTFPESGIDERYLLSDQRTWVVRCPACAHQAPLAWALGEESEHHVDEERALRVCGRCDRAIGPDVIASGRWVPRRPRVAARGYHVSKLIVPAQDVASLVAERRRTDEDSVTHHHNFSLGLAYAPRGGGLTRELVLACRRDWSMPEGYGGEGVAGGVAISWVTAGVDVGKVLHVRISGWLPSGKAAPLHIGTISGSRDGFRDLAELWRRYSVNFGLVDERPEERAARAFMQTFPGRVKLVRWAGEAQHEDISIDEEEGLVIARRTWAMDQTVDQFGTQVRYLPAVVSEDYLRQLCAPHKVVLTTPGGQKVARYDSGEKEDHFFFAETYDILAKAVRPGGEIAGGWGDPPLTVREEIRRRHGLFF